MSLSGESGVNDKSTVSFADLSRCRYLVRSRHEACSHAYQRTKTGMPFLWLGLLIRFASCGSTLGISHSNGSHAKSGTPLLVLLFLLHQDRHDWRGNVKRFLGAKFGTPR